MQTSAPGVISKESKYAVKETLDKLQKILQDKGVSIYARIDQQMRHSQNRQGVRYARQREAASLLLRSVRVV